MPNFQPTQDWIESINKARTVVSVVQNCYWAAKSAQELLLLYQAATDNVFNQAIDLTYVTSERQELNQMLAQIDLLITNWETNHRAILGIEEGQGEIP